MEREQQVMERLQKCAETLLPEEQLVQLAEWEEQAVAEMRAESEPLAEVQRELQEWPE